MTAAGRPPIRLPDGDEAPIRPPDYRPADLGEIMRLQGERLECASPAVENGDSSEAADDVAAANAAPKPHDEDAQDVVATDQVTANAVAEPETPAEPERAAAIAPPATTPRRRSTAHPRAAARTPAIDTTSVDHADFEAEDSVVASAMQNSAALATVAKMVADGDLSINDFYQPTRGQLCGVLCALCARGVVELDPVTVRTALEGEGSLLRDLGGRDRARDFLHHLYGLPVVASSVRAYAEIVHDEAVRRQLDDVFRRAQELAQANGKPAAAVVADVAALFAAMAAVATRTGPADDVFIDWPNFWERDHDQAEWVYPEVLARGRGHALYAAHKLGKSLFMLWVAAQLATGSEPVVVVYLDYEMTEADVRDRLEDMGYGLDIDFSRLRYALLPTLPPLDTADGARALTRLLDRVQGEWPGHHVVVIIDTISRAVRGEEDKSDTFRDFYNHTGIELKRRGITWARLDHSGKDPGRGQRGSSGKGDDVDVVWALTKTEKGVCLRRDVSRMGWVPDKVTFAMSEEPLRYRRLTNDYPEHTGETANLLDRLGVPLDASTRTAAAALKALGEGRRRQVVIAALRFRKDRLDGPS